MTARSFRQDVRVPPSVMRLGVRYLGRDELGEGGRKGLDAAKGLGKTYPRIETVLVVEKGGEEGDREVRSILTGKSARGGETYRGIGKR